MARKPKKDELPPSVTERWRELPTGERIAVVLYVVIAISLTVLGHPT